MLESNRKKLSSIVVQIVVLLIFSFLCLKSLGYSQEDEVLKLIRDLENQYGLNSTLRAKSAALLGMKGDRRAVQSLINSLRDKDFEVRRNVVIALGKIGDPRAVEPLLSILEEKSKDDTASSKTIAETIALRILSSDALGEIGDERAVNALSAIVVDETENNTAKRAALNSLNLIGQQLIKRPSKIYSLLDDQNSFTYAYAIALLGEIKDPKAFYTIVAALKHSDEKVRISAARTLEMIKDREAVEPLIATLLQDNKTEVRKAVVKALGEIGDPRAVEPLIEILLKHDENLEVREFAAEGLGKIGDSRAVKPLMVALTVPPESEKSLVEELEASFDNINDEAIRDLLAPLKTMSLSNIDSSVVIDKFWLLRSYSSNALGKLETAKFLVDILIELSRIFPKELVNDDISLLEAMKVWPWDLIYYIENELIKKGNEGVDLLIDLLRNENEFLRRHVIWILKEIETKDERVVEPLLTTIDRMDAVSRVNSILLLGQVGDPRALQSLVEVLNDENTEVRRASALALGKIGDSRAAKPLIDVLNMKDEDNTVRSNAAEALGKIADSTATKPLIKVLVDRYENKYVRRNAAEALGLIKDKRAVEPLIGALKYSIEVQSEINSALKNITGQTFELYDGSSKSDIFKLWMDWWKKNKVNAVNY